jgi:hypothetical protein
MKRILGGSISVFITSALLAPIGYFLCEFSAVQTFYLGLGIILLTLFYVYEWKRQDVCLYGIRGWHCSDYWD